jgi:TRAP-type C4-dicarboxylate transport system permease small subunit
MAFSLRRFNRISAVGLFWATAMLAAAFTLTIIVGVAARYVWRAPILGSEELSRLFFVWACFMAAALGYRQRAHIAISFLAERLSAKTRGLLEILMTGLSIAFFALTSFHGVIVAYMLWPASLPASGFSQGWFYAPVPLACALMFFFALEQAGEALRQFVGGAPAANHPR